MKQHQSTRQGIGRRTRLATCVGIALALGAGSALAASPEQIHQATAQVASHSILTRGAASGQTSLPATATMSPNEAASTNSTAATITVANCNDSGGGSLRAAVDFASSGDTIDMSGLSCSTISLNSSIVTSVNNLTLKGNSEPNLPRPIIDGQDTVEPLRHNGSGTLNLVGLSVWNGHHTLGGPTASGGCVFSAGNVALTDSAVKYCTVENTSNDYYSIARGGGIFAKGDVTLSNSRIQGNTATSDSKAYSHGGGIYALGKVEIEKDSLVMDNTAYAVVGARGGGVFSTGTLNIEPALQGLSTISGNTASTLSRNAYGGGIIAANGANIKYAQITDNTAESIVGFSQGGGLVVADGSLQTKYSTIAGNKTLSTYYTSYSGGVSANGDVTIDRTTISGNSAQVIGGLALAGSSASTRLLISNSTISGNTATKSKAGAGIYVGHNAKITNSTITGNIESNASNSKFGAGLSVKNGVNVNLSSTIVSGNKLKWGSGMIEPSDIGASSGTSGGTLTGDHNFITFSNLVVPADTIGHMINAGLAPLADNGGPTKTHALSPGSQAIDTGVANGETEDQRGSGFSRVMGPYADIGAYELGGNDIIFADGFESP